MTDACNGLCSSINASLVCIWCVLRRWQFPAPRPQDSWTALMHAALHGHVQVVNLLLEKAADINATDKVTIALISQPAGLVQERYFPALLPCAFIATLVAGVEVAL